MMRYRGAWPTDRFRSLGPTNEPFCSQPFVDIFNDQTRAPPFCVSDERRRRACTYSSRASPVGEKKHVCSRKFFSIFDEMQLFCFAPTWHRSAVVSVEAFVFSPSNVQMRRHLICILNRLNLKCLTKYASSLVT